MTPLAYIILPILAAWFILIFAAVAEDPLNFNKGWKKMWGKTMFTLRIILYKIRNRPKFKKGDSVEWINHNSMNEDIMCVKIHDIRLSMKTPMDIKWVYDVGNENDTFGHHILPENLRISLYRRRVDGLDKLLN